MHFLKDPELTMPRVPLFTSPSPAEERHHKRSGKAGDDWIGRSISRSGGFGTSSHSRSRTRTRALDPAPTLLVVEIERPAAPRPRPAHPLEDEDDAMTVEAEVGAGAGADRRWEHGELVWSYRDETGRASGYILGQVAKLGLQTQCSSNLSLYRAPRG